MCYALRLPAVENEYVMRLCNDIFGHEKEGRVSYLDTAEGNDSAVNEEESSKQEDVSFRSEKGKGRKKAVKVKTSKENEETTGDDGLKQSA